MVLGLFLSVVRFQSIYKVINDLVVRFRFVSLVVRFRSSYKVIIDLVVSVFLFLEGSISKQLQGYLRYDCWFSLRFFGDSILKQLRSYNRLGGAKESWGAGVHF